jgi:hypothetical protein
MLILIALGSLLLTPVLLGLVRLLRPRLAFFWLAAAGGAGLAWPLILLARLNIPIEIGLATWRPFELFPVSPALLVDRISWPYALALSALILGVVLSDTAQSGPQRAGEEWLRWAGGLALTGLSVLSVLSANYFTLLLAWAAVDTIEFILLLTLAGQSERRERMAAAFTARAGGLILAIWAAALARSGRAGLSLRAITPQAAPYLMLAAGLRLGVTPLRLPDFVENADRRSLASLLRLAPAASSLLILARIAPTAKPPAAAMIFLLTSAIMALYGSLLWSQAEDELEGRRFFVLGVAGLTFGAAAAGQTSAALAWGLTAILPGGLLFLYSARRNQLRPLLILGMLGVTALPLTPAWGGVGLYGPPLNPLTLLFLPAHALLIYGYLRHALRPGTYPPGLERWVWLVYPLGLALFPTSQYLIAFFGLAGGYLPRATWLESLLASWPAVIAALAAAGLYWLHVRRGLRLPEAVFHRLQATAAPERIYQFGGRLFEAAARASRFLSALLEGDGGILWTLLLLVLLLTLAAGGSLTGLGAPGGLP